jgi:hypothetical protein
LNHDFHYTRSNCLPRYLLTIGHPNSNHISDPAGCNGHTLTRRLKTSSCHLNLNYLSNLDYGRLTQIV